MKRQLKRVHRQHGIKYFAFPVVVLLLLAALFDQRWDGYLERREEYADLRDRQDSHRSILDLNANVQRNHDALSTTFVPLQPRLLVAPEVSQAVNAMQEHLRQLLSTLYFDNIEFSDFVDTQRGGTARISMTAKFNGVPQQLPRLEAALAQSSTMLGVENLEIRVVDDPQRGGKQLAIMARFTGLHVKPMIDTSAANAPIKSQTKP